MTDWSDIEDRKARRAARPLSNSEVLGFIWRYWISQPRRFALICALMLFATLCDLSIPWAAGGLIDAVSKPMRAGAAAWGAWATLSGLYLVFYLVRTLDYRLTNAFAARNMEKMVNAAFQRVQSFSSDWHANTFAGATVRRVSRSMWGYDQVSDAVILMLGPTLLVLSGLAISMAVRWAWAGAFCAAIVVAFIAYNVWTATHYIRPANLKSNALDSAIGAALADAIGGNAAVKSFGAEAREEARFAVVTAEWRAAVIRTWNRFNTVGLGQNLLLIGLQAGLTGMLVKAWSEGRASPGDVAFAITSFMLMSGYMRNFGEITRMMQRGLDDALDVAAYLRQPPEVADRSDAQELTALAGEVRFDQVSFRYKGQPQRLYDGFSLTIHPGERVALVGATGAGKSTFVKLIQRLYDVEEGRILIDGTDIAQVTQASLRSAVALVPQDPALFHRSLAENIAYARPDATANEIELAARRARAHDFIARLPQGYDTLVGERGIKLSGGERQRVAIARAFLADAPILVLDEATSSLDVETEREVQAATEALMIGRTTIVIAHRLSTIRSADRILVFQAGRVVEEGRHGELLRQGGVYARLADFSAA
ncbi:MAG: ABC transporter ATP-binding protein [Pseudomonadota bacterium]|jgi:ATP-binding cassette subfamily B protein